MSARRRVKKKDQTAVREAKLRFIKPPLAWTPMDMDAPDVMELMHALAKNSKKDVAEVCAQMRMMQMLSPTEIALCFGTWVQKMETTRRPETDDLVDQCLRYMQEGNLKMVTKTNQEIFDILVGRTRVSNSDAASTTSAGDVRHE